MAFSTLKHNLIDGGPVSYDWPSSLPKKAMQISELLTTQRKFVESLRGKVSLIAGGPPCQGFSTAGRRNRRDPRNRLVEDYLEVIRIVRPTYILLENVKGFTIPFGGASACKSSEVNGERSTAELVADELRSLGYLVEGRLINCADFGLPQRRERFFLIGVKTRTKRSKAFRAKSPFVRLKEARLGFLRNRNLPLRKSVTVEEAIGDLCTEGKRLVPYEGDGGARFSRIERRSTDTGSSYIKLMHRGLNGTLPTDLRLPNHRKTTIARFKKILRVATPGVGLTAELRRDLGSKKMMLTPLSAEQPSVTLTTLPDDILHYAEPRILTVREMARLQSFPDGFSFKGNYTTGGTKRKSECPRYTQVGNAVPPLIAELFGELLMNVENEIED